MSDLISRSALIEKIRKYGICGSGYSDEERINDVIDMIESEPSAQQWIPCSERLPEEDGEYLCQIDVHGRAVMEVIGFSNNLYKVDEYDFFDCKGKKGFYGYDSEMGYYETSGVIAWMPLPEPYKGE